MDEAITICTIAWSNCLRASSAHSFDQIECKIFLKKAILPRLVWEMETSWCAGGQNRNFWTELMLWKTQTILECADLREGRCSNGNKYTAVKFTVWKQLEENWGKEMSICKSLLSGAFAERKTKQSICFALFSAEYKQPEDFSSWLHDKVGTLNSKHWAPVSCLITFSFYAGYCQERYWQSDWKWKQQTSGAKTQDDSVFSIALIWLIRL